MPYQPVNTVEDAHNIDPALMAKIDEVTKRAKSGLRLVGQFLWVSNKDPALRVKRPVPRLG